MKSPIAKSRFCSAQGPVKVVEEADFDESQIDSVVLVIAATDDRELNQRISDAAQARYRLGERGGRPAFMLVYFPVDR